MVLEEEPREIRREEAGAYFQEYAGMLVANAHCPACLALYLAWVDERPRRNRQHARYFRAPLSEYTPYVDLSYRSSFNDEPGITDLAIFHAVPDDKTETAWRRIGIHNRDANDKSYFGASEKEPHRSRDIEAQQRWFARRDAAVKENNPPIMDGDLIGVAVYLDNFVGHLPKDSHLLFAGSHAPKELLALSSVGTRCDILVHRSGDAYPMVLANHLERTTHWPLPNGWAVTVARWATA